MFKQRSHETHHDTHLPQIESHQGQYTIALLGDSLFERFKTTGENLSTNKNERILNLGVGGDKVQNVQYRINQGLLKSLKQHQQNLKLMYVHMGSNNLKKNGLRKEDAESYDTLIKEVRTEYPDIPIIITALFIQRGLGVDTIEDGNEALRKIADSHRCEFLPFGTDQTGIMSDDNVHLNEFGYTKWNEILEKDMRSQKRTYQ
ncbi:SGNH hydrolase-type esterase domain-containing protein [Thelonectria olida]|uniref:SGNH hydrolase-type esterase domain-containing protein n=1 Tax=Thelonectria olida TaxID=1576542 RepID=A0A9P8W778_9HYPO|nr:SGNH hydrolase-type esterase domain-containing protein [Thelonectria olida]